MCQITWQHAETTWGTVLSISHKVTLLLSARDMAVISISTRLWSLSSYFRVALLSAVPKSIIYLITAIKHKRTLRDISTTSQNHVKQPHLLLD
jgi:hypothetical protein